MDGLRVGLGGFSGLGIMGWYSFVCGARRDLSLGCCLSHVGGLAGACWSIITRLGPIDCGVYSILSCIVKVIPLSLFLILFGKYHLRPHVLPLSHISRFCDCVPGEVKTIFKGRQVALIVQRELVV